MQREVFAAAAEAIRTGRPAALATVILANGSTPRSSGARMVIHADGSTVGTVGGGALELAACRAGLEAIRSGKPTRLAVHLVRDLGMCCGGQMEVYVEPLQVCEPFWLFGAGHVAQAVAPLLRTLDFTVTVVDDRDELATAERFPGCAIACTDPREFARSLAGAPDGWVLIATHDHALDLDLGEVLLPREWGWIGMIGSQAKVAKFFLRWKAAGLDEALFTRLSAPVGLDIGAETPAEIAVSVAAELVRVRRRADREPAPLSARPLAARGGPTRPGRWRS